MRCEGWITRLVRMDRSHSITLTISGADLGLIIDHCRRELPNEACGLLAGRQGTVEKVYCMRNARPSPVSYEMDPQEQFVVLKEIRSEGRELTGIFHSHPSSPAVPSGADVERAYWPGTLFPNHRGAVYVIVSLPDGNKPVVKGYTINEGTVAEVALSSDRQVPSGGGAVCRSK